MIAVAARAQDATSTITFDDRPLNSIVTTQYVQQGMSALFHRAVVAVDPIQAANQVAASEPLSTEFPGGGMRIDFLASQNSVSLTGTFSNSPSRVSQATLEAFDSSGNLVASHGPLIVVGNTLAVTFSVTTTGNIIDRVVFTSHEPSSVVGDNEIIDDVQFTGEPPPPPTGGEPSVAIDAPVSGLVDVTTIQISGSVSGANLFQPAVFSMDFQAPPPNASHFERPILLIPTSDPNVFTFSFTELIPKGTVTLTMFAESVFGLSDSAQVVLTNLPGGVLGQCTPGGPLGAFLFALPQAACTINVCENGGISSHDASGTSRVIPAAMMTKWLSVSDAKLGGNLGCPLSDATPTTSTVPAVRQDFQRGRLYQVGSPVFFVPGVFAQAMAVSGEETGVGVPDADPRINTFASDVDTKWYQHFQRLVTATDLGTTMELRGQPPVLSVARQGGDLADLTAVGATFGDKTATLWQRFPCTGNGPWACAITPPQPHVDPSPTFVARVQAGCSGGLPKVCADDIDPIGIVPNACANAWPIAPILSDSATEIAWPPLPDFLPASNYAYRDLLGWVRNGHRSNQDFPLTHSHTNGYNINVRPFAPYDGLLLANFANRNVELEIEWYYFQSLWKIDLPSTGDLFFSNGRWITDCGHNPFPSELHPLAVMAIMRTQPSVFLGPTSPRTTYAIVTANGFFRGALTTVRIEPPPRPSPNARLFVIMPSDSGSAVGGISVNTNVFFDHVDITFSRAAPITQGTVSEWGEMFWPAPFGSYTGLWNVGWTE